ncbi:aminotransferase class I/II-fold pyridoxal phosphate-dependent enzyme [Dyadobacter sp. 3J3]|uniref:aminotransferase class I/II-fold pyridoxal phosphate-dependent enzyme n=1 Tax=Dyadobacter sp. 3J3 TaxID=2606600 RepID=UPI00135A7977|nr:aminotransferase class I/II-fold pyridoxal phosphate-dependent enzyme [Dyadobacter sp. 3J3]
MNINFATASFKDFENVPELDAIQRADLFYDFLGYMKDNGHMNYRLLNLSGCGPEMRVITSANTSPKKFISFVCNDYLGFTQHPSVIAAVVKAVKRYGTGAGASPLIGGHFSYHQDLEEKIAKFFGRSSDSSVIYTTGYTANSASLQVLLQKEDIAIVDMSVHASVYEGCMLTNRKSFLHNDLESLERILKDAAAKYRTKMVIVDGVYSQDGDIAPLDKIYALTKQYGGLLMVDDAHGIGVLGNNGRGAMELLNILEKVDIITGTFSKTFSNVGGYVVTSPKLATFLKFQSRQHIFSATAGPASAGIVKAIDLIDEQPLWRNMLASNISYLRNGLVSLGFDIGNTQSAIIPVKIGDAHKTSNAGKMLLEAGIYANPILYPAVSKKNARIRMSVMATHTREHLDRTLNAFEDLNKAMHIVQK